MKLISIQLCNFRQFYGKTPDITLAAGLRNTTIIHGNNGAGKTTILNAFTWVLYEKFTAAFASPDLLVNKRAITEANFGTSVDCWVEMKFEHDNKRYQINRLCSAYRDKEEKIQYSKNELRMLVAGDDIRGFFLQNNPRISLRRFYLQVYINISSSTGNVSTISSVTVKRIILRKILKS